MVTTYHSYAVRVQGHGCCAGSNLDDFLGELDGIVQPHVSFALAPNQPVAHAHLPSQDMQPFSGDRDIKVLSLSQVPNYASGGVQFSLSFRQPRLIAQALSSRAAPSAHKAIIHRTEQVCQTDKPVE